MFSTDKNIETIGQLIEVFKHYIGLQNEYLRLDVIEKIVRLITALLIASVVFLNIIVIFIYLSFAAAYAMAPALGTPLAFLIVALFYLLIFLLVLAFRKKWVEKPLVRFLASLLMEK
ncbi:MAG: phage holin family protein [Prevotellaceae bacterium]|nr:phage holin family protein [Prevotella sp.]MDD7257164.1 phage holin family protein [Prevotellaceae bacterium]MDY6130400.1 phage holin family protein [Prevotella sp.]